MIITIYIRPNIIITEGMERQPNFVKQLDQFQTKCLKCLLGCQKSASSAIVRLFSGTEPLSGRLDLLK